MPGAKCLSLTGIWITKFLLCLDVKWNLVIDEIELELVPTQDILASAGKLKEKQFLVGFALETDNELENAKIKLRKKNLDMIVLNSLQDEGAGFRKNTNKITIIDKNERILSFELKEKSEVAKDIFDEIMKQIHA